LRNKLNRLKITKAISKLRKEYGIKNKADNGKYLKSHR
jgi:hypothetical protein